MLFFVYWHLIIMKNIQLSGLALVLLGSFLPLVHVPLIGNWNYWKVDHSLSIICWLLCFIVFIGIMVNKKSLVRISSIILILLFCFTIFAVRYQSQDFFSFLPFDSWVEKMGGLVKLKWGWVLEFLGASLLFLGSYSRKLNKN